MVNGIIVNILVRFLCLSMKRLEKLDKVDVDYEILMRIGFIVLIGSKVPECYKVEDYRELWNVVDNE